MGRCEQRWYSEYKQSFGRRHSGRCGEFVLRSRQQSAYASGIGGYGDNGRKRQLLLPEPAGRQLSGRGDTADRRSVTRSTPTATTDDNVDGNDDGAQTGGTGTAILSPVINLTGDVETSNEPNQGGTQDDSNDSDGNMTIDLVSAGPARSVRRYSLIWTTTACRMPIRRKRALPGVTVQLLYDANNDLMINGTETIPVITTTTDAETNGDYFSFGALPAGNYGGDSDGSRFGSAEFERNGYER